MKAVVKTGGKQYQVAQGDVIKVEKLPLTEKGKVVFEQVLLLADKDKVSLGAPYLTGVKVEGTLLKNLKDKKIDVLKYKNKTRYRRKIGHRHQRSEVKIDKIITK
ncbi:MAG: 50S ribosomal protein L21 [Patescibacteria group bacterium]|nr:50S ribosomal protein L21 [Patescibacteria group bacterium]